MDWARVERVVPMVADSVEAQQLLAVFEDAEPMVLAFLSIVPEENRPDLGVRAKCLR